MMIDTCSESGFVLCSSVQDRYGRIAIHGGALAFEPGRRSYFQAHASGSIQELFT